MGSDDRGSAALDPGFLEGRFLVEIETWDANLHLGLSSKHEPAEYRFQGGLSYVRSFEIHGRILAPKLHRAQTIRVWLSPFGPELQFDSDADLMDEVGQVHFRGQGPERASVSATLLIPETALTFAATCLSSVWKYLHIWTCDERDGVASVRDFSFSSAVHKNLQAWIAEGCVASPD